MSKVITNTTTILLFQQCNGYRIYVDIMKGKNCRQFRLLTWNSFIGKFVLPVGGEGIG